MPVTKTASAVFGGAIEAALAEAKTCLVGEVVSYDETVQKAVIRIVTRTRYTDEDGETQTRQGPTLSDVPIQFPGGGVGADAWRITWPIVPGTKVRVEFTSASIDRWLALGGHDVDPEDDRHHDINDAIAVPGVHSYAEVPTDAPLDALVIHGAAIKLGASDATDPVARRSDLVALHAKITAAVDGVGYGSALKASMSVAPVWPPLAADMSIVKAK